MRLLRLRKPEAAETPRRRPSRVASAPLREPVPKPLGARTLHYLQKIPRNLPVVLSTLGVIAFGAVFLQYLFHSSYFNVRHWEIVGSERLNEELVRALVSDGVEEIALLQFSTEDALARLTGHPVVHHAYVRKLYPDGLQVVLQERRPRALLVCTGGAFLVDIEGVLIERASHADLLKPELPILTSSQAWEIGDRLPEHFIGPALLYVETLGEAISPLAGQLSEIHWSSEQGITLYLLGGTRLVCGGLAPRETLPRAAALASKLGGLGAVDYADLRLENDLPWRPFPVPAQQQAARR